MGVFDSFLKPKTMQDPDVGTLKYDGTFWVTNHQVKGQMIEVNLDGNRAGVDSFAKEYWLNIREDLDSYWDAVVKFTQAELIKKNAHPAPSVVEFKLENVSVYKEKSFDGGHLSFWFEISTDDAGLYYVSFRNESPFFLHRDS